MKTIILSHGKVAKVDDEDFESLNKFKWYCNNSGYAIRHVRLGINKRTYEFMHRAIMKTEKGFEVDHINRDPLDNRKCNMRNVTHDKNVLNVGMRKSNTSGYRGVFFEKRGRKHWRTKISIKNHEFYGGSYNTKVEAALAYDGLVCKYANGFVELNFPTVTMTYNNRLIIESPTPLEVSPQKICA